MQALLHAYCDTPVFQNDSVMSVLPLKSLFCECPAGADFLTGESTLKKFYMATFLTQTTSQ